MDKYEVENRLTKELESYVHIKPAEEGVTITEEEYQELRTFLIYMKEKHGGDKK